MSERLSRDAQVPLNAVIGKRRRLPGRRVLAAAGIALAGLGAVGIAGLAGKPARVEAARLLGGGERRAEQSAPPFHADCSGNPAGLQREIGELAAQFNGVVGIAVVKAGCNWVAGERAERFFPQQSVSKLWVSLSVLNAVDRGRLRLDAPVTIRPADLVLFNQPLRWEVLDKGSVTLPIEALMRNALTLSDNLANDRLLWTVGGPDVVRATLREKGIGGIRFGPGERLLQSAIAGLNWTPQLAEGRNFEQARAHLPMATREAALARYLVDPMDGATPRGIATALARLAEGRLLSPQSSQVMLGILAHTHSGPMRLKAGAPAGWKVFHKTGTGQELGGLATGYNDVGLLEAPDGSIYGVAVMIGQTHEPIPVRMKLMQGVARAVGQFHRAAEISQRQATTRGSASSPA